MDVTVIPLSFAQIGRANLGVDHRAKLGRAGGAGVAEPPLAGLPGRRYRSGMDPPGSSNVCRSQAYTGLLRTIGVAVDDGDWVPLRAGECVSLPDEGEAMVVTVRSGLSRVRWAGSPQAGLQLSVGFRNPVEALLRLNEIYIEEVATRELGTTDVDRGVTRTGRRGQLGLWMLLLVAFLGSMAGLVFVGPEAWVMAGIVVSGLLALCIFVGVLRDGVSAARSR